ncbi:protein kinase [Streptomyces sp. NPDC048603]|uniref:protein kinase domain-containing protein n=1 Tax=Streptomyces sp. NPDC048603 TaxID=3365577 RepID=UPI0037182EDF
MHIGPDSAPDRYRLLRSIGRGGEAVLYLAEIELAGGAEPVVVKVLDSKTTITPDVFGRASQKWNEQAELLRFVHRPGVVGVREHFEGPPIHRKGEGNTLSGRALVLVMNHVDGLDLRDWRAERTLATPAERREVMRTLEQLADVLDWLHSGRATPSGRTVIHGDLSPGNVMVDAHGQATLVDFGLSKLTADHQTAEVWFTPGYAAPEVFEGKRTPGTDRYAFGAIAYFLLSGESPPPAPGQLAAAFTALPQIAVLDEERRARIVEICASDPGKRTPSLASWMKDLRHAVVSTTTSSTTSRPVSDAVPPGFVPPPPTSLPRVPPKPAALPTAPPPAAPAMPTSAPAAAAAAAAAPVAPSAVNPPVVPPTMPPPVAPAPTRDAPAAPAAPTAEASGPAVPQEQAPPAAAPAQTPAPSAPSAPTPAPAAPAGFGPPAGGSPYGAATPSAPGAAGGSPYGPASSSPYPPTYGSGPGGPSGPTAESASATSPTTPVAQVAATEPKPKPKKKRGKLILASALAVLLVAAGAVAAAAVLADRDKEKEAGGAGDKGAAPATSSAPQTPGSATPSPTPEPSDTASEGPATGSPAPSGSGSGSPAPIAPGTKVADLTVMNTIAGLDEFEIAPAKLNTTRYSAAFIAKPDCYDGAYTEFDLNKEWKSLEFTAGIDDGSNHEQGRISISLDDRPAEFAELVELGKPMNKTIDVTGALRLRIKVEKGCNNGVVVIANPQLKR